jgi:sec-independent protein translocase protein TatB
MFPEGRIFEFLILGAVALIVVGPKDLPILMRKVGQFMARMRAMAAEFRASFDEIARQSELDELRREVNAMRASVSLPRASDILVGPETRQTFDEIQAGLGASGAATEPQQPDLPFAPAAPRAEGDGPPADRAP